MAEPKTVSQNSHAPRAINRTCPWSGKVVSESATTDYRGQRVGFCDEACKIKFEKALTDFDQIIDGEVGHEAMLKGAQDNLTNHDKARPFERRDAPELLDLMKQLAEFEGYRADFAVEVDDLIQHGLGTNPQFKAWVIEDTASQTLSAMAVTYEIAWTYTLKPTLVLKELFVKPEARGYGLGAELLKAVFCEAGKVGADKIKWMVLNSNFSAKRFYRRHGGDCSRMWENWECVIPAISD